ncbi:hypothetical protein ABW19_dt0208281 [Dactylella cylindrospora]|nr:hypothetical protein ABW19_dt0208281 [Dactylella cylindrospora]
MFFSPQDRTLEAILTDHTCGATLIFKVLTTPFFDEALRAEVVQNVKNVLLKIKAHPAQGYKRLMDEVGLPTRSGGSKEHSRERRGHSTASPNRGERNRSRDHHHSNRDHHHHDRNQPHGTPTREYNQPVNPQAGNFGNYEQGNYGAVNGQVSRNGVMDPMIQSMDQLNLYGQNAPMVAPQQYPAAMMGNRGARPAPQNFYPAAVPTNVPGYVNPMAQMPTMGSPGGLINTNAIAPQNGMTASPVMPVGMAPGFNPMMAQNMMGGYGGYPPNMNGVSPVYPQQGPQNNAPSGNRRVSSTKLQSQILRF